MSNSDFKIPKFISKAFNSKTQENKDKLITQYKNWYSEEVTEIWIKGFQDRIDALIKEDESFAPSREFEFQQQVIANRAERLVLRSLIKEMNYKV